MADRFKKRGLYFFYIVNGFFTPPTCVRHWNMTPNTRVACHNREPIVAKINQSINQFSGPAYPWGVAGAAARVGASKHLDPLQQRIDALLGCQGETN